MVKKSFLFYSFIILFLISCGETFAVGALFCRPRWSSQEYQKMWIKSITANVDIQEQIAVTTVKQSFYNELNTSVESIFIFPLPENATITKLVYWVNGERFEASIRERQQAINDYNEKLRHWLDPALLEYLGDNLFRLSIVPINAQSEVKTEITYVEPLIYDLGKVNYLFQLNTLQLSSKPLQTVTVNLDASSQYPYLKFSSPSHYNSSAAQITKISDNHYKMFFGDENFYPDKDLKVEFETKRDSVHFNVLTYIPSDEDSIGNDKFYSIWISPPDQLDSDEIIPKDIIFTADVSSSMEGERITQVKDALKNFLSKLNSNDKFNIITFGTFVTKFKDNLVEANQNNIEEANSFVNNMFALGLTNISDALNESLNQSFEDSTANDLIFLTDGNPTWGDTSTVSILSGVKANNSKNVQIFSFGVGENVSRSFLTTLSVENHGLSHFVTDDDSIALVVNYLYEKISKPVMTDIQIYFGGLQPWDQYPKTVSDLFWGSQVTQLGLFKNSGTYEITLRGKLRSKDVEYKKIINFPDSVGGHRFVPRLWAKEKINNILNLIEMYGETPELVNQVIELSYRFQILTPYTAFYVDPDPTAVKDETNKNIPADFVLEQNYPNPFNPSTVINYSLPSNSASHHVMIRIYNALGQLIAVLVDKDQAPGNYRIIWNGTDSKGDLVSSGVYFYSLKVGNFIQLKKMVLMR